MMNVQALTKALAVVHTEIDSRAYWDTKSQKFLVQYPSDFGGYKNVVAHLADLDAFDRYVWVVDVTGDEDRLILVDL
jgi:hypothetical protein